jgi:hypothetical protein
MKKMIGALTALVVAVGMMIGVTGCDVAPEQIKVVAQNAGLFSAVGWIAIDNPDSSELNAVKSILSVIKEKASDVKEGSTYTEVLYPELVKVIEAELEAQYKPIAKAGSLSLLGGIDMLFATHPEWKKDQDTALQVVNSFISGAQNGLSLSEDDEAMKIARDTAAKRARVYRQ